jgi:glycerol-3-phosphate dehydrogenase
MRQNIRERKITVEGFDSVWALHELGKKYKLDLPMVKEIYQAIYQKASPKETIKNLIKMAKVE